MLIGVVSDTHRNNYMIQIAKEYLKNADMIIHLGDNVADVSELTNNFNKPVVSVKGNCDFNVVEPSETIEIIEGKKFFITHGNNYNVKSNLNNIKYRAMELEVDVVLFGHTHISEIIFEEGIWFINPGSVSMSRKGGNSIAFIDISEGKIHPYIKSI